jgi:hypothetical protein
MDLRPLDRCFETVEALDVLITHEDVDVLADAALFVENAIAESRVATPE